MAAFSNQALLMMAHGSRDAEARDEYRRIHAAMSERLPDQTVVFSVLEFPDDDALPSIKDGWGRCLAAAPGRVVALPFFLFPAGHVREDLPAELREAEAVHGRAELDLLPPLGAADELLEAVDGRASEALDTLGAADAGDTALVLVGAGTSDPDANGDLCKAARLVWERFSARWSMVEPAWVSLTRPTVQQTIDRCVTLGARRIVVMPFFLNTGVLLKRIDARLAEARLAHPGVPMARAAHLGLHPRLLDLMERRARAALSGVATAGAPTAGELFAVCGRPSCQAVAAGRAALLRPWEPTA